MSDGASTSDMEKDGASPSTSPVSGSAIMMDPEDFDARFRAHVGALGVRVAHGAPLLHSHARPRSPRDTRRRRALAVADVAALLAAYSVMLLVARPGATLGQQAVLVLAVPFWIVLNKLLGLYDRDAIALDRSTLNELPSLAQSVAFGSALVYLFGPALLGGDIGRIEIVTFCVAAVLLTPLLRGSARHVVRRRTDDERCIIVGSGVVAAMVARKIAAHPELGARVLGFVDEGANGAGGTPRLGGIEDFEAVCRHLEIERVIVAFTGPAHGHLLDVIRIATRDRLKISIVPRLFEVVGHGVKVDQVEGLALMTLRGTTRTRSTMALKRALDISGAAIGLLALAPVAVAISIAIKLTSAGPVFFCQPRVGRGSREFRMFKFRTMVADADLLKPGLAHLNELDPDGPMFKISQDPRLTPVGGVLRRTSLDELPQLWNVLRGEMSLVGPRPLVPDESARLLGWHRARLDLTPGLTGPWQVLGRTAIPFDEMVKLDYLYVADWSLWNDVKLILRTLPVVARRSGA